VLFKGFSGNCGGVAYPMLHHYVNRTDLCIPKCGSDILFSKVRYIRLVVGMNKTQLFFSCRCRPKFLWQFFKIYVSRILKFGKIYRISS
jgi:hypothetical protein